MHAIAVNTLIISMLISAICMLIFSWNNNKSQVVRRVCMVIGFGADFVCLASFVCLVAFNL